MPRSFIVPKKKPGEEFAPLGIHASLSICVSVILTTTQSYRHTQHECRCGIHAYGYSRNIFAIIEHNFKYMPMKLMHFLVIGCNF